MSQDDNEGLAVKIPSNEGKEISDRKELIDRIISNALKNKHDVRELLVNEEDQLLDIDLLNKTHMIASSLNSAASILSSFMHNKDADPYISARLEQKKELSYVERGLLLLPDKLIIRINNSLFLSYLSSMTENQHDFMWHMLSYESRLMYLYGNRKNS
jgi:hypothetical protein